MEGYFALDVSSVELKGRSLFSVPLPSQSFAEELHSFSWLYHMRAFEGAASSQDSSTPGNPEAQASRQARAYVLDWIERRKTHDKVAFTPLVTARRALCLTNQAAFLLNEAGPKEYRAIMAAIVSDARSAYISAPLVSDPTHRCFIAIACASVAHALVDQADLRRLTGRALVDELKGAFLPDGGPVTRRPGDLQSLLSGLITLVALMEERGLEVPPKIKQTLNGGSRMLSMLRHSDGTLMRSQGTHIISQVQTDLIASILFYDIAGGPPINYADSSKFVRLSVGKSAVLLDCGIPPASEASREAHAALLAMEWSHGGTLIVTNAPEIGVSSQTDLFAQRQTHAHSTATVNGRSSLRFAGRQSDAVCLGEAVSTTVEFQKAGLTQSVVASHSGFQKATGLDHWRSLTLQNNGAVLQGRDWLAKPAGQVAEAGAADFVVRFHLKPGARVDLIGTKRATIYIRNVTVEFAVEDGLVAMEDPEERGVSFTRAAAPTLAVRPASSLPIDLHWTFSVVP